jgi:DNA-binding transcriptional regulator LsrR (DeoR family)
MKELKLKEFLITGTQSEVATAMGIGQSAVSQMVAAGRDIRVRVDEDGRISEAYEVKPVGRFPSENQQVA